MAKYSVGGTEIIDDSGLIDWSKITGAPSAASVTEVNLGTTTNCGTYAALYLNRYWSGGTVVFDFVMSASPPTNCNCNCNCNCDCS